MKYLSILLAFSFTACIESGRTPETSLQEFIDMRAGNVVTRQAVLEKVTGKMRQSLENVSDEEFQKFADLRNVEPQSFKVLSKSCQETKCFLTYSISFKTTTPDKAHYSSEVKKIAEVQLVEGKWLIADVSNIKTYHEASAPIEAMGDQAQ